MMDRQQELAITRCLSLMLHLNQQVKSKILEERKGWVVTPSKPLYSYFGHILRYLNTGLEVYRFDLDPYVLPFGLKPGKCCNFGNHKARSRRYQPF